MQDWKIQFEWKKLEHPVNFATERIGFSWKAMSSSWNFVTLSQDAITNVFFAFSANTWHRAHYYTVVKQWQTTTLHCRSCVRSWLALDTWKLEVFALNEPLRIHAAVYFQNSRELTMPNTTREFVERTSSSRRVCQSLNMVYGIERSANNTWQIHLDLPHLRDRLELLTYNCLLLADWSCSCLLSRKQFIQNYILYKTKSLPISQFCYVSTRLTFDSRATSYLASWVHLWEATWIIANSKMN